ncbi:hypothetical protein AM493_17480 [Flavobacterium akiainvivens]|uniref:Uncharacterized protein n=1 Tax=Flavobacterium akiainvivens TaxID=1202724 RepID=A0A0M8MBF8_9FLAO|nr:hypothetical protein [Flavobacterium akiainvivens]KOS07633.1 hypothetical protein AM493_17480 [Flavobacterium akiainvivens]SFQ23142.1 hypothetical protein SAMN05444144_10276 [Flavobacterium akiainvivens]
MILRIAHYVNYAAVALTITLYTAYGFKALTAQFLLGCYQVITAIILTVLLRKFEKQQTVKLLVYWILVITWLLLALTLRNLKERIYIPIILCGIPMCIAGYFVYVTYVFSLNPNKNET